MKVLVGMSGGVDSTVTVHLLQKNGYNVRGVFLRMLDSDDGENVKMIATQLEIELSQLDIRKNFERNIIAEFIKGYQNGLTPNPCVVCNLRLKFKYLLDFAGKLDIKMIATGHYARIEKKDDKFILKKAKDNIKDQSYFLYRLTQQELSRIIFPLGGIKKTDVKELAKTNGIEVPRSESQDICFLKGEGDLNGFLRKNIEGANFEKGNILDEEGNLVGSHKGLLAYTIGQRRGLDVNGGPFYVVSKNLQSNTLIVSKDKGSLKVNSIVISDVNWIDNLPEINKVYQIKIRYQTQSVEATLSEVNSGVWNVQAKEDVWAIAPGQSLVVYDGDIVLGGGIMTYQ